MCTVEHLAVALGFRLQFLITKDRWWLLCSGGCSGSNCIASIMFKYTYTGCYRELEVVLLSYYHYTGDGFAVYSSQQTSFSIG